jgi:hypothetical protein
MNDMNLLDITDSASAIQCFYEFNINSVIYTKNAIYIIMVNMRRVKKKSNHMYNRMIQTQ